MKARDIMDAMDMLDQDLIIEARSGRSIKSHGPRRLLISAAVIALVMILAFTVVAVSYGSDWFAAFFSERSGRPLSREDMDRIGANTAQVGKSQVRDGYTITLESAFTDGKRAFFRFLLTAPEGTALDADWYGSPELSSIVNERGEDLILDSEGFYMGGGGWRHIHEQQENEITLLYTIDTFYTGERSISDTVWIFYIDGLWKGYRDEEEGRRTEQLSEGVWSFEIRFPEGCEREVELISEPVTVLGVLGGAPLDPAYQMDPVDILSCRMRALTVEIYYRSEKKEGINADFGVIYAVMKNGEQIPLRRHGTYPDKINYLFDAPIDLDQVEQILFHDGTVIPVESVS